MSEAARRPNLLQPLGEDTIGPYYPYSLLDGDRCDLTRLHPGLSVQPQGETITLLVSLLDSDGAFVPDALIEFWQANAAGVLRTPATDPAAGLDPYFDGFGRLMTSDGPFEIRTIKPGQVPGAGGAPRAPHITLTIFSDGVTRLVTQIFFDDEVDANAIDPLLCALPADLRARLVARRRPEPHGIYELAVIMRGVGETPFFDDLSS